MPRMHWSFSWGFQVVLCSILLALNLGMFFTMFNQNHIIFSKHYQPGHKMVHTLQAAPQNFEAMLLFNWHHPENSGCIISLPQAAFIFCQTQRPQSTCWLGQYKSSTHERWTITQRSSTVLILFITLHLPIYNSYLWHHALPICCFPCALTPYARHALFFSYKAFAHLILSSWYLYLQHWIDCDSKADDFCAHCRR
jgi:hypothetical protein